MPPRHTLPNIWLISDERNDAVLDVALRRLPRGSGFIYRHYHLPPATRAARFAVLKRIARARGHVAILSGSVAEARRWGADGAYGAAARLAGGGRALRLVTVHSLKELARAGRADAVLLSPVFPTRSHPGGKVLGPLGWRLIAARARTPVIALGGINPARARRLKSPRWAAIDAFLR